jgi:hypothetical protein
METTTPNHPIAVNRGQYKIIRVDGTEELIDRKPNSDAIHEALGCDTLDTIRIGKNPVNGPPDTVMFVDDIGAGFEGSTPKPVNPKATALYHSVCRPGTTNSIHGDVAIVNDEDFA